MTLILAAMSEMVVYTSADHRRRLMTGELAGDDTRKQVEVVWGAGRAILQYGGAVPSDVTHIEDWLGPALSASSSIEEALGLIATRLNDCAETYYKLGDEFRGCAIVSGFQDGSRVGWMLNVAASEPCDTQTLPSSSPWIIAKAGDTQLWENGHQAELRSIGQLTGKLTNAPEVRRRLALLNRDMANLALGISPECTVAKLAMGQPAIAWKVDAAGRVTSSSIPTVELGR